MKQVTIRIIQAGKITHYLAGMLFERTLWTTDFKHAAKMSENEAISLLEKFQPLNFVSMVICYA